MCNIASVDKINYQVFSSEFAFCCLDDGHTEYAGSNLYTYGETQLDVKPVTTFFRPTPKMLEDAQIHRATMETAFRRRSKDAHAKYTKPKHAIPIRNNDSLHHMESFSAMRHHMINPSFHKKSIGGIGFERWESPNRFYQYRPSASVVVSNSRSTTENNDGKTDYVQGSNVLDEVTYAKIADEESSSGGIIFTVPKRRPTKEVQIEVEPEVYSSSESKKGELGVNNDSDSFPFVQSPVAIESYLPWKELALLDPNTEKLEEAAPSQNVYIPPGRDSSLKEWDRELPKRVRLSSRSRLKKKQSGASGRDRLRFSEKSDVTGIVQSADRSDKKSFASGSKSSVASGSSKPGVVSLPRNKSEMVGSGASFKTSISPTESRSALAVGSSVLSSPSEGNRVSSPAVKSPNSGEASKSSSRSKLAVDSQVEGSKSVTDSVVDVGSYGGAGSSTSESDESELETESESD